MYISIAGLDKATVLAALYNASRPVGLGALNPRAHQDINVHAAAQILASEPSGYFDYVQGRVLKVDLSGDAIDPVLFDRDNGGGSCAAAIDSVRETKAA